MAAAPVALWLATATRRAWGLATMAGSTACCATNDVAPMTPQPRGGGALTSGFLEVDHLGGSVARARPVRGFEHGDDSPHRRGRHGERLAQVQVVGEISVKREGLLDGGRQPRLADPVAALVSRVEQFGGGFRVVRLGSDVAATGLDRLERNGAVRADERSRRAL